MRTTSILCIIIIVSGVYFWWQPSAWYHLKGRVHSTLATVKNKDKKDKNAEVSSFKATSQTEESAQTVYRYKDGHGNFAYSKHPPKDRPSTALTLHNKDIYTIDLPTAVSDKKQSEQADNPYALTEEQKKLLNPVDRMRLESAQIQYQMQAHREKMIDETINQ